MSMTMNSLNVLLIIKPSHKDCKYQHCHHIQKRTVGKFPQTINGSLFDHYFNNHLLCIWTNKFCQFITCHNLQLYLVQVK
jgi:hypothetical protein